MRRLPPLAAVRVFEAAARHGNFITAAAELGMTQAAVSYQIRMLEERLGVRLFDRERGRVVATPAARRAAGLVSTAFDGIADAFASVRADDDAVLRISCANTFAIKWLAPHIGAFQLRHPDLAVRIDANDAVVDFARDDADVGVRAGATLAPGLHGDALFDVRFTPMASPEFLAAHPLADPADLQTVPRLTPEDDWWPLWLACAGVEAAVPVTGGLRLDSQVVEANAAMAGAGVALLNPELWRRELDEGRLFAPFAQVATNGWRFWLVCAAARRNVPKIRAFREWLLGELGR
ncbi:LysR substrate-binding domain-containing protein [Glacieibacterium frigidum]|uniref:LysR family transcriptional regulator n=1 Tax=Glacieibacterium frigidum TaxID=2593303 RepID=A0A552UIE3_9SPHN|nr:LysR substrate-binding domain-containing protein [Glacieibacterium frigidum]TRW17998.1 LysR family transcriptional regulator [Glacieibacterium frigidum]